MSLPHTSLHQSPPGRELPNIREKISNDVELSQWRECLYRAMTQRSKTAISHLLSAKLGIIDTISILNKRNDKTKKSQWATLQAIIQYKKNYAEKKDIGADDVRIELELLNRDFSGQRTVQEILGEIRTKASKAQETERNAHLGINIAGFETPIVGAIRDSIIMLLDAEQKSEKEPIMPTIIPEKNPITTANPPSPPQITLPLQVTARGNIPRRIDAATLHQVAVAAIQRERAEKQKITPPIPPKPENNTILPVLPKHPQSPKKFHQEKTTEETLKDHVTFVQEEENMRITGDAQKRASRNGKIDAVIFENYIRGKNMEILTRLQAIKRLKQYSSWGDLLVAITKPKSTNIPPHINTGKTPPVPPKIIQPTPPPAPTQKPVPQITTIIPPNTPPVLIEEEL